MDICLSICSTYYSIIIQVFEGSRHEVLHDKDQDRARQLISDWVLEKLAAAPCDTPPSNANTLEAETTEQAEITTEQAEITTEQAETTEQAGITTEQAETTTEQAESTTSEA